MSQASYIQETIKSLIDKFPHRFDNLVGLHFESSEDTPLIAYSIDDDKVFYNENMFEDDYEAEAAFAFISFLVANKHEYCVVPEGTNPRAWNLAIQHKIIETLNTVGEFDFPEDAVNLESIKINETSSITEIVTQIMDNPDYFGKLADEVFGEGSQHDECDTQTTSN